MYSNSCVEWTPLITHYFEQHFINTCLFKRHYIDEWREVNRKVSTIFCYVQAMNHSSVHDGVIKRKHFPRCWPFVREIGDFPLQRPVIQSFDVFFDLYLNKRVNNRDACDLKCNRAHYAVTVMKKSIWWRSLYLGHVTEDFWSVHGAISLKLLAGILTRLVTWSSSTHKLYFNKYCFPVVQSWCLHLLQH